MGTIRKLLAVGSLTLSLAFGLSSCETTTPETPEPDPKKEVSTKPPKKRVPSTPDPQPGPAADTTDPAADTTDPAADTTDPSPDAGTTPPVAEDYKFGVPVPGRPGMIRSPHNPDAGLIDARGLKPGTKIRCPFTSKVIKVP